ncbi:ABC transporter ATP-binding protein [Aquipuribacter sp. MA13-13]|uniref:ABC transporter ATP-binding protein n=1 Tax=Aquipuribacter sp. MA13-13 TaxID=3440840 RepID=UPI003F49709C
MTRSGTAVSCRGVGVRRGGVAVVHDLDLTVERGEWVCLVGPNGAGKTSLLHAVGGLLPFSGGIQVAGVDPARAGERVLARVVGLMPQRPVVPESTSVRELVALGRTPHLPRFGSESDEDRRVVEQCIERLCLDHVASRPATQLSGGELQRVVLARALAQQPQVLLLDEPTSALDIGHQQTVLQLVDQLRREEGLTVVAAMHDLTSAGQYGDRLVLLEDGRVVADGPAADVLLPATLARVYGARVQVLDGPDGPVVVPVRSGDRFVPHPVPRRGERL